MSAVIHVGCDAGAAKRATEGATTHPNLVLTATILASSLAFIDGSVINVGLPSIARALHAGSADLQWLINAYQLPLSALLLLGGAAGDRFGQKRMLILGTVLFALASGGCALAPDMNWLLFARAIQGIGAALLTPCSLAILGGSFTGAARGQAIGTWAAAAAMAAAVGPVVGGWLIDTVGWRAIFLVNLPIAAGAILLALAYVNDPPSDDPKPLDVSGAALATLGLGALTWALTIGLGSGGWTPLASAALAVGIAALAGLIWVERTRGETAMMPLTMFASKSFVGLTLLTLLIYGALTVILLLIPFELMQAQAYPATAAGTALLPFPLLMAAASPRLGAVAGRIGARAPLLAGSLLVAAAFVLATLIGGPGSYWLTVLPAIVVLSLGMAAIAAPLTTAVLAAVDDAHRGAASGFNSAAARAGGLIGTAFLGPVLSLRGAALTGAFHAAVLIGALAALIAAACTFVLVDKRAG